MLDNDFKGTNLIVVDTFDYNNYVFYLVKESNNYYLRFENNKRLIKKLVIKPNFWAIFKDGGYEDGVKLMKPCLKGYDKILAMDFVIDPNIFDTLISNDLICYSKAMADLYNLPVSYSRDIKYHQNDYKRTKNKELVLSKMRQGIFN